MDKVKLNKKTDVLNQRQFRDSYFSKIKKAFSFNQLLLVDLVIRLVVLLRIFYFIKIRNNLQTLSSDDAFDVTVEHNLKGLAYLNNNRMDILIKPISALEFLDKNSRILVIGPRNEGDIFKLIGHGFQGKYIRGLDLISYSPLIDIGDMHATEYADNSFDVIISGWTLSYSKEPEKFAKEALRIANNGCVIAIAVEYGEPMTVEDAEKLCGYSIIEEGYERINSTMKILSLFGDHVDYIYFQHDAPNKTCHSVEGLSKKPSCVCVIFTVRKD